MPEMALAAQSLILQMWRRYMDKSNFLKLCKKYRMSICAMFLLLSFICVIFFAERITVLVTTISVDTKFWPRIIGYAGCGFSLLLLIQSLVEARKTTESVNKTLVEIVQEKNGTNGRALKTLGLIFLYILGLDYLGFFVMTALYLFFQFMLLSDKETRKSRFFAYVAVIFTVVIYLLFHLIFHMMLPQGKIWMYIGGSL